MATDLVMVPRARVRSALVAIVALTLLGVIGLGLFGWAQLQQQHINDRLTAQDVRIKADAEQFARRICDVINESRADARALMQRGTLDAGTVLIQVASSGPISDRTRAAIDRYRTGLENAEARIVSEHAADDRDCAAEARLREKHPLTQR